MEIFGQPVGFDIGTSLAAFAAFIGVLVAWRVHSNQESFAQRQLVLPLWEKLIELHEIDPNQPNETQVREAVNTLELVATCYQNKIAHQRMIERTFGNIFLVTYSEIDRCPTMSGLSKSGKELLDANPSIEPFYLKLRLLKLKGKI